MTHNLILESADKEWCKLDGSLREQFKKKLKERLENPRVRKDQRHGARDRYKIKLKGAGYRLVYQVMDAEIVVLVIAVGKREGSVAGASRRQTLIRNRPAGRSRCRRG